LRLVFEDLVIIIPGHDPPFDPRIGGMGAPADVTQALIESDRGALRIPEIEV
jgi:hypothetical protein